MKVSATESVHKTVDKSGNTIFTVKLDAPSFLDTDEVREVTRKLLEDSLEKPVNVSRWQPIRDWTGRVIAYAIWKEK
jgi:2-phosphoglycerate kinase